MAPQQTSQPEPGTASEPVLLHRDTGVFRAARSESACRRQHWRDDPLVPDDRRRRRPTKSRHTRLVNEIPRNASRKSATSAPNSTFRAAGLPMTTSAPRDGAAGRLARYASRSRRRALLRWTAPRTCRLTANPTRRGASTSRQRTTRDERSIRLPCWNSAWKSALPVNRSRRLSPPFRPSVVCAPCRAGASGPSARPASSSARGSRGSSRGDGDSAGTSASWCRVSLSIAEPHKCRHPDEPSQIVDALATSFQRVLTFAIRF